MCIQGADVSCWRKSAEALVPVPHQPRSTWWQFARLLVAVPLYVVAMGFLYLAAVVIVTGNRISGRRWIPSIVRRA